MDPDIYEDELKSSNICLIKYVVLMRILKLINPLTNSNCRGQHHKHQNHCQCKEKLSHIIGVGLKLVQKAYFRYIFLIIRNQNFGEPSAHNFYVNSWLRAIHHIVYFVCFNNVVQVKYQKNYKHIPGVGFPFDVDMCTSRDE